MNSLKEKNNDYTNINKELTNEISVLKSELLRLELQISQKRVLEDQITSLNREITSEKFSMLLTQKKRIKEKDFLYYIYIQQYKTII